MNKIKRLSTILFGMLVFMFSAVIFVACKDDKDYEDLYVFAKPGGSVQVNNEPTYIRYGDGGKKFEFEENSQVNLKAISDEGYTFIKWEYSESLDKTFQSYATNAQITITLTDDIVIRAVFGIENTQTYNVVYDTSAVGYRVVPEASYSTSVAGGGTFKFKVDLDASYSESDIVVKSNGSIINPNGVGVYSITNINQNINIVVEGVVKNRYVITMNADTGYHYTIQNGDTNVEYGNDFSFSVQADAGYENYVVTLNGSVLEDDNGIYTIPNVRCNYIVAIHQAQMHTISSSGAGFSVVPYDAQTLSVVSGDTFKFTISVNSGYKVDDELVVIANNGYVTVKHNPDAQYYYIENVNTDIVITVSGIQENALYAVSITNGAGYSVQTADGVDITQPAVNIEAGSTFAFKIVTDADKLEVKIGGKTVTASEGIYSVVVNENKQITIDAYYKVTLPIGTYYALKDASDESIGTTMYIPCGTTAQFKVVPNENYEVNVSVEGKAITGTDNLYQFSVNKTSAVSIETKIVHIFALDFKDDSYNTVFGALLPEKIKFAVDISKPTTYKASEFDIVQLNAQNAIVGSIKLDVLMNTLNRYLEDQIGPCKIDGLYYNDALAITIDSGVATVDWSKLNSLTGTLHISVQLIPYVVGLEFSPELMDGAVQDMCGDALPTSVEIVKTDETDINKIMLKITYSDNRVENYTLSMLTDEIINLVNDNIYNYTSVTYQNETGANVIIIDGTTATIDWNKLATTTKLYIMLAE